MNRLQEKYNKEIVPQLQKELEISNRYAVPRINKIVVNTSFGRMSKEGEFINSLEEVLKRITGQKPLQTKARKSISNFKLREGSVIGMKVTLRGKRMYDFLDKLINISFPRVRDFRGVKSEIFDGRGNCTIGFKEYLAFPEIKPDEVEKQHGLEIVISTKAQNDEHAFKLLKAMGFPFKVEEEKKK